MVETVFDIERQIREVELEQLEKFKHGTEEAPILYRPSGELVKNSKEANGDMLFIANEETEDRTGDIIEVGGWDLANFKKNPVILFGHDHRVPPVGTAPKVFVEGKKLMNTVAFDIEDPFAKFLQGKFERRVMRAESVGFRPIEFERKDKDGDDFFFAPLRFTKQELLEISLVSVPAHPKALRKAMGDDAKFYMIVPANFEAEVKQIEPVKPPTVPEIPELPELPELDNEPLEVIHRVQIDIRVNGESVEAEPIHVDIEPEETIEPNEDDFTDADLDLLAEGYKAFKDKEVA